MRKWISWKSFAAAMPQDVFRKSQRRPPTQTDVCQVSASTMDSTRTCSRVCGERTNSSFDSIRANRGPSEIVPCVNPGSRVIERRIQDPHEKRRPRRIQGDTLGTGMLRQGTHSVNSVQRPGRIGRESGRRSPLGPPRRSGRSLSSPPCFFLN